MFTRILPFFLLAALARAAYETHTNDEITIKWNSNFNQPRFSFWANADPNQQAYKVKFEKIYELKDGNKVGDSNLSLPSISWNITIDTEADGLAFWIQGTDNGNNFKELAFYNKFVDEAIKFDVIADNYVWKDEMSDTLNLEWSILSLGPEEDSEDEASEESAESEESLDEDEESEDNGEDHRILQENEEEEESEESADESGDSSDDGAALPMLSQDDEGVCFEGADGNPVCWKVVPTADILDEMGGDVQSTTGVSLGLGESSGTIVISYSKFENGVVLFHDPMVGYTDGYTAPRCFILCWIRNLLAEFLALFGF